MKHIILLIVFFTSCLGYSADSDILRNIYRVQESGGTDRVNLKAPALAASYDLTLPSTQCGTGTIIRFSSAGVMSCSTATYPDTATSSGTLLRANGTNWVASGTTLVDTGTSGGVPYYSASGALSSSGALTANGIVLGGGAGASPTSMTGTSGGIPYFNATTTVASSGALTASQVVIGGGAGAAPTSLAAGTNGHVLTMGASAPGYAALPSESFGIKNLGLATSVSGNALTISIKQADGSTDPAPGTGAVKIGFRSSTLTSGLYNERLITAASAGVTTLTISSGSTMGQTSAVASTLYLYEIDNAGTIELAASTALFHENQLVSTTAEGGAGAADSSTVMYSTTARTNVPVRLIGKLVNTQATAGTWASAGTSLHVGSYGSLASELSTTIEVLTGSGNYTAPYNAKYCMVYVTGAGGNGGDGSNNNVTGGGGGGGGTAIKTYAASALKNIAYVVGAASGSTGGTGGDSTFTVGGTAQTGSGGVGASSPPAAGAGGAASNGDMNVSGGFGTNGGNGTVTWATSGSGGTSFYGGGARGGIAATGSSENGATATCYGGGGGGGSANSTAHGTYGAGKAGTILVISFY